ncbi:Clavaminate synthase-like protein, partial [Wilcoxina mikolae CBS 423.85]
KRLNVELDGQFVSFDQLFLRDACSCPHCIHPSTQQKLFQTTDIPYDVRADFTETLSDGSLRVRWKNDISIPGVEVHESIYTPDFLRRYSTLRNRVRARHNDQRQILWDKRKMESDVLYISYSDYMNSDEALFRAVRQLSLYGLMFIRGVPEGQHDAIEGMAERIGNLKNTFYGKTWDVKSVKYSKNIAYTPLNLSHHMDLLYFESPPGLQFLHCIQNTTKGGTSIFADSFRAATVLRLNSPQLFRSLTKFPVTYHYQNDGYHYHFTRPTVVLDEHSYLEMKRISHVNWAPPFQAPFEVDIGSNSNGQFRQYIVAAKEFAKNVDDPDAQFELRLEEGVCAVFFNRRILHSRRAFDPSTGDRWLKGAYVDIDAFHSKYRTLSEQL